MTLSQRPLLALLAGLLSLAAAQGPGAACTAGRDAACDKGHYCEAGVGACAGAGVCAFVPDMCTEQYDPVCGCDGATYSNDCKAAGQGVGVKSKGACAAAAVTTGAVLDGACGEDGDCDGGKYCIFATGECGASAGECVYLQDSVCTEQYDPVCGCDGVTYSNACFAGVVGVSVKSKGACAANIPTVATENGSFTTLVAALSAADLVGTLSGDGPFTVFAPTDDAFAALPKDLVSCLLLTENKAALTSILTYHVANGKVMAGDLTDGMTVETLEGSTVAVDLKDGVKINNSKVVTADVAADNGVIHAVDAVLVPPTIDLDAFLATCEVTATVAVCTAGDDTCGKGNFCQAAAVGTCDGSGTCAFVPEMCPMDMDQVCGCDDSTYDNECKAHTNGVSVKSQGKCDDATGDGVTVTTGEGVVCANDAACDEGKYCQFALGECDGSAGALGGCDKAPAFCTMDYKPVCGCDDVTHSNACEARAAGVSVKSDGACVEGKETTPDATTQEVVPVTVADTAAPTKAPTKAPTVAPVSAPTEEAPTKAPTKAPTAAPVSAPTEEDADPDDLGSTGRRSAPRSILGAGLALALALACVQ